MLSHRRQSQPQSEAGASISGASFHDPAPDSAVASHGLNGLKFPEGIDGTDSGAVFVEDEASEMSFGPTKEHTEARMSMVQKFSHSRTDTSVRNSRGILGTYPRA